MMVVMLGRGVRVWLAVLGLLGGLLVAPAPAVADCCPASGATAPEAEVAGARADGCCPDTDRDPPQPAGNDGCKCPRPCCVAPAPVATIRLPAPEWWGGPAVGVVLLAAPTGRSAEYHLDLMRPPRA